MTHHRYSIGHSPASPARWWILLLVSSVGCYSTQTTSLDDFELFFRFRADGAVVEFTTLVDVYGVFVESGCGAQESLQIAAWEPWDQGSRLGLSVSSLQARLGAGTYSIAQRVDDPTFRLSLYYRTREGIDYFADPVDPRDVTLVISNVGPGIIEGTFFGIVKAEGHSDIIITEGEFAIPREHDIKTPCRG